jgi:hypothetical protein
VLEHEFVDLSLLFKTNPQSAVFSCCDGVEGARELIQELIVK